MRAYIKEVFTQKAFGDEYVCHIGSYNTYGLKSALIDMTRVFGGDRNEILAITTKLGLKDDEGDPLSWDKALEIYPTLKDWVERNPQIAAAAKGLLYAEIDWDVFGYKEPPRRNRSMGTHAGGVIISSKPITDLVPLVRGKDGARASAWVEGLHGQDLSLVGLVKFDCLVIEALTKVSMAIDFIRKRNPGIHKIMAVPGGPNFSDLSYLNDPACLKAAADGDLKMIFQFDSEYIRKLAMSGGITSFDDMVALTALNRPGPMELGMDYEFVNRKKWKDSGGREGTAYHLHPLMEELVGTSYGVLVYQEDIMRVLNRVGLIPLSEGQSVIKAISKKQIAKFAKFKDQFVANAQKTLGITEDEATALWDQIEAFAGYGFNKSHAVAYTYVTMMQMWLKTHYPIEYITAVLCCLKTGDDRLQEYKLDADRRGVKVVEADINLSGVNFEIREDRIYWGLSKIKGIGEDMAAKIVEHQPYHDFKDFLDRFGTDGTVMKSLLGVRIFKDQEPTDLMRFYLKYKDHEKKKSERAKRFQASQEKLFGQLREVLNYGPDDDLTGMKFEDFQYRAFDLEKVDEFRAVWKKVARGIEAYQAKQAAPMDLADEGELDIDPKLAAVLDDADVGQMTYYGFVWTHPLQKCPNASLEFTFDAHKAAVAKGHTNYPVDVLLVTVEEVVSKKGKPYCRMQVEDAQFVRMTVNVWMDDYLRFKPELKAGSLVRLDLDPPSGGFPSYGLHSVPPWKRRSQPPKEADFRVVVLGATEVKKLEV